MTSDDETWAGIRQAYVEGVRPLTELAATFGVTARRIRARAQKALGDRFDVREFHEIVLREGAIPLDILERNVEAWIREQP